MLCERGFSAHGTLEDRFHETNRIGRREIKLTDLILRRREAPVSKDGRWRRSLVAVSSETRAILRGARPKWGTVL